MNYCLHLIPCEKTVIYNKISNEFGSSCYPDILFRHDFPETEIIDNDLYVTANELIKTYGSSRVLFAACKECDKEILENIMCTLFSDTPSQITDDILKFSDDLALSETMKRQFFQLMNYYQQIGGNPQDIFIPFRNEYALPVRNKNEGKRLYELIRNQILG